jgi:iron-sulfur cluster repair protein YtfE (RIC family)
MAADAIGEEINPAIMAGIDEAVNFLTRHLIPHAQAEDKALYPVVQKVMGAAEATATMSRDHVEVGRLSEELLKLRLQLSVQSINHEQLLTLRRLLYGLYALVKIHFAKEEEIYLPLLDQRLSQEEANAMFIAMESAAHEAKEHLTLLSE